MKILKKIGFTTPRQAQTASELAIFGAVLLFVIGLIARAGMSTSQTMNHQLKAMRTAMTQSFNYSMRREAMSRNTASVIVIEDRLSVDAGSKFGTRDRIPFVASGGAAFSNQFFQELAYGEEFNLPVADIIINGQRFPFRMGGFRTVATHTCSTIGGTAPPNWESACYNIGAGDQGCAVFYKQQIRYASNAAWHDRAVRPCGGACYPYDDRFDLDHNRIPERKTDVPDVDVPAGQFNLGLPYVESFRSHFNWQWVLVPGLFDAARTGSILTDISPARNRLDPTDQMGTLAKEDSFDVDGDLKDELVYSWTVAGKNSEGNVIIPACTAFTGVVTSVNVLDSQSGDIDATINDRDERMGMRATGLEDEIQMFSFTREGTYYQIHEGKLFEASPLGAHGGQFIRNTSRQDHVDIVQRIFKMSNDTGRFCSGGGPANWAAACSASRGKDGRCGLDNPVEACNNCFSPAKVTLTCFDSAQRLLFIRSRISDLRGRRWVTRMDL
ncbi:MAG: hypothetical protein U1D99_03925 [Candidatus Omnitrophota bacterium]|nr:hypothetical protein [Candidatus Omnitrophota bacterium]